jgi:hypothetical protein
MYAHSHAQPATCTCATIRSRHHKKKRYETYDVGLSSANIGTIQSTTYGTYSFRTVLDMLVLDTVLYAFFGWYLDQVKKLWRDGV